jgi:hypothetical protein
MGNKDYIPSNDDEFDNMQTVVFNTASENETKWLIHSAILLTLEVKRIRWTKAIKAYRNKPARTPAIIREKNDARKDYESSLRNFIQGQIIRNTMVSNADLRSLGLPVRDRTPTKPGPPKTRTETEIKFTQIMEHFISVRDSESKHAAKPPHVIGFQIYRLIGGKTEPAYEDMQFVAMATRSPYTVVYTSEQRGQMVFYATRWVNTRGETGPWSEIVSAIIP